MYAYVDHHCVWMAAAVYFRPALSPRNIVTAQPELVNGHGHP